MEHRHAHRLCILGNSHAAGLWQGWEEIRGNWPSLQVDFLAQRGNNGLATALVDGRRLTVPPRPEGQPPLHVYGKNPIDTGDYDSFLIYGLGSRPYWPPEGFISAACLDAVIRDLTDGTAAQHVLHCLRQATEAPIFIGHTPLLAARAIRSHTVDAAYQLGLELLNRHHFSRFRAEMVGQPPATIVNGRSTAPEYSWGSSVRLTDAGQDAPRHSSGDNSHMNAVFGALWLESFLPRL